MNSFTDYLVFNKNILTNAEYCRLQARKATTAADRLKWWKACEHCLKDARVALTKAEARLKKGGRE